MDVVAQAEIEAPPKIETPRYLQAIEIASVVSVCAMIALLFVSAVSRYAFDFALVWSDEVSSCMQTWMVMLGAIVAVKRNDHMRLTTVLQLAPPTLQRHITTFVQGLLLVFLVSVLVPISRYVVDAWTIRSPLLEIPYTIRLLAIPFGLGLICWIMIADTVRGRTPLELISAITLIVLLTLGLRWAVPVLESLGNYNLLVFFVAFLMFVIFAGMPIAFAFGIATFSYLVFMTDVPLTIMANRMAEGMSDPILSAIPLFVFLGSLMVLTGLARTLVEFLYACVGHLRGGVSYVMIASMYLVSGISGAKAADMAAVAPVLVPEMERRGKDRINLVALMAATGAMSETIPPSLVLIATGVVTGVSIKSLFTAGFIPALVCAVCLIGIVAFRSRNEVVVPRDMVNRGNIVASFVAAIPGLLLPILIRTFVVKGITTATEISAFAIGYTLVFGGFRRCLRARELYSAALAAASLSGAIILILGFVTAMAWAITQTGFSSDLGDFFVGLPGGKTVFMLSTVATLIVLGSVLEGIPAVVLVGPILFPIAKELGISEVHYAIVVILAMGIGLFMPPFGIDRKSVV